MRKFSIGRSAWISALIPVLAGCAPGAPTPGVSPRQAAAGTEASGGAVQFALPVRISRELFEGRVSGRLQLASTGGQLLAEADTPIDWVEKEPTEPAPTGDYIADFRDFEGCARYAAIEGVELCFVVMPDVSSLDVEPGRMHEAGLRAWVNEALQRRRTYECDEPAGKLRFVGARKSGEEAVTVTYEAAPGACGTEPLQVRAQLRRG